MTYLHACVRGEGLDAEEHVHHVAEHPLDTLGAQPPVMKGDMDRRGQQEAQGRVERGEGWREGTTSFRAGERWVARGKEAGSTVEHANGLSSQLTLEVGQ
jgi:hypothetical protein